MSPRTIIADILIAGALIIVLYTYYPIIAAYTPLRPKRVESTYSIEIPKINAYAPVIANVDPWNKDEYQEPLKSGVAQAKDFADFGEGGTVFLFAHSSLPPWEITRTNTAFLRLGDLDLDDEIIIKKFDKTYIYKVVEKRLVWPQDVTAITTDSQDQLILQTCAPQGTDVQRLLIYAKPVIEE